jgi:hypothetical protein
VAAVEAEASVGVCCSFAQKGYGMPSCSHPAAGWAHSTQHDGGVKLSTAVVQLFDTYATTRPQVLHVLRCRAAPVGQCHGGEEEEEEKGVARCRRCE